MCPTQQALPRAPWPRSLPDYDDSELDGLLQWLLEPEEASPGAGMALGHKPCSPATPAPQSPCYPKVVSMSGRPMAPSPFALPEAQSAAPCTAAPAPPRHTPARPAPETYRSVSFRALGPKHAPSAGERPQGQAQRAASCSVLPRLQPLAQPRTISAGAGAQSAVPPAPPVVDSALAWAAGFSRLAMQLGCAAPAPCGGLWDPPESSDLLALLTLELSCSSHTGSPALSGGSSVCGGSLNTEMSSSSGRKRKASWEPAWPAAHACGSQRPRHCLPPTPPSGSLLF